MVIIQVLYNNATDDITLTMVIITLTMAAGCRVPCSRPAARATATLAAQSQMTRSEGTSTHSALRIHGTR